MPQSSDLQTILADGQVDESVVASMVRRLLDRMNREGRVVSGTSIDVGTAMAEIFPAPGSFEQTAYERHLDPSDRSVVYNSVVDASTAPRQQDRADLRQAMDSAAATAGTVVGDEAGLRAVFGDAHWSQASIRYRMIRDRLRAVAANIERHVTTDYNLDAQETFLGGWARFSTVHMHLLSSVVVDPLTAESRTTILHEGALRGAPAARVGHQPARR